MFTNWIKLSARYATQAMAIANMPQNTVNILVVFTVSISVDLFFLFLLYRSIVVVVANAFNSLAVEDIAALKITAINKPIKPLGKLFKIKLIKT